MIACEWSARSACRHGRTLCLSIGLSIGPLVGLGIGWSYSPSILADEAVIIGGGYDPQGSQVQIELNVRWVRDILEANGLPITTYFTDGDAAGVDVHFDVGSDRPDSPLSALARVFGDADLERRRYRENDVLDVSGSTERGALMPALGDLFERTQGEPLLLVYNGHGGPSPDEQAGVTLELWQDSFVSARELHGLLDRRKAAREDPFRFVFTQCYSGGFHRLAYADPTTGDTLSDTPRCGFTAESAYRLAEGCSAGIDSGDYRDYSTFFFAAVADQERDGSVLDRDPDDDADGETSLREAHLYALEKAHSTDLSRSTSEDWLDNWQPWYLRWLPMQSELPNNEYARLFRTLAVAANLPLDDRVGRHLRELLKTHRTRIETLRDERERLRQTVLDTQAELQRAVVGRWPTLLGPYTTAYRNLAVRGELDDISLWIEQQPGHADLVLLLASADDLDRQTLATERELVLAHKLLRLRHLAVTKGQLAQYGSADEHRDYAALLACEELPLVVDPEPEVNPAPDTTAESALD